MSTNSVEKLLKQMLTENTGKHLCDSGGAYGRHWQRNQDVDFDAQPGATAELQWHENGLWFDPTINIYHWLKAWLDLDEACEAYNALPCEDWDSEYFGVSKAQMEWLDDHDFEFVEAYNTYNFESGYIHSQITQGTVLRHTECDDLYVLLQIHGGCDVRGGYTDAKMFYLEYDENAARIQDACASFYIAENDDAVFAIDVMGGDLLTPDGDLADDDYIERCCRARGMNVGDTHIIIGDLYDS